MVEYEIIHVMTGEFFTYALVWLLTFAITYGVLNTVKIPKMKSTRGVISIVIAFLILPTAAPLVGTLAMMARNLIMLVVAILVFIVLLELMGGTKRKEIVGVDPQTGQAKVIEYSIFDKYAKHFAVLVILFALIIFISSGGFDVLGISKLLGRPTISIPPEYYPLIFFLGVIAFLFFWMVVLEKEK